MDWVKQFRSGYKNEAKIDWNTKKSRSSDLFHKKSTKVVETAGGHIYAASTLIPLSRGHSKQTAQQYISHNKSIIKKTLVEVKIPRRVTKDGKPTKYILN